MLLKQFNQTTILLFVLFLLGCKSLQPIELPALKKIPDIFDVGVADTAGIGSLPKEKFFADSVLIGLIDTALQNNLDLKQAITRIEIAQANLRMSRGNFLPSLNGAFSTGVDKFGDYTMNGVGNFDSNLSPNLDSKQIIPNPTPDYFLGVKTSWEIGLWGKYRNLNKAAYARFLASYKGKHLVTTALVAQVASLYYNLLALDNELATIRKNIDLQNKAMETVLVLKQGGRANELAVKQFEGQLYNTQGLEFELKQEIVKNENMLNQLLGRFPQPIARGRSIVQQELPRQITPGLPVAILRRRPDIHQAELDLIAAKADVKAAKAAFLPSLNISAYSGYNAFKTSILFDPASVAYGALAGLTVPFFARNQIKNNYKITIAENTRLHYAYQNAILNGFQEVQTSFKRIENYKQVTDIKKKELEALQKAVTASNDLFLAGYASYLEVITAQRTVLQAELGMVVAKKEQFLGLVELYRALGGGW